MSIRKLLYEHITSRGIVTKTGQAVAVVTERRFGRGSDVSGVVRAPGATRLRQVRIYHRDLTDDTIALIVMTVRYWQHRASLREYGD